MNLLYYLLLLLLIVMILRELRELIIKSRHYIITDKEVYENLKHVDPEFAEKFKHQV